MTIFWWYGKVLNIKLLIHLLTLTSPTIFRVGI